MNIFYFNRDVKQCAKEHCDKHVVKMIIEYAQLLSTAHRVLDGTEITIIKNNRKKKIWLLEDSDFDDVLYAATHVNHPSAKWVRQCYENYSWLLNLWIQLCFEYSKRYGKTHKTFSTLFSHLIHAPINIVHDTKFSAPWRAMPDQFKVDKSQQDYCQLSYQNYFKTEKKHLANWKNNEIPKWFV